MADFCKACSLHHFNQDAGDLAGLCTPQDNAQGFFAQVLCEGCGPIYVDHEGVCQGFCLEAHPAPPPPSNDPRGLILLRNPHGD